MPTWSQQLEGAGARLRVRQAAMQLQDLADLPLDRVQRVERGHRLLEHHGDVVAAHRAHLVLVGRDQVLALEQDAARRMMRRRIGQELAGSTAPMTDLPEPDSPTSASVSPGMMSNEMRSTASMSRAALAEGDGEILDGEERVRSSRTSFAGRRRRAPLRR